MSITKSKIVVEICYASKRQARLLLFAGVQDARVSKASRFTRGKPDVPNAFILEEPNRVRPVPGKRKAGRFTYETALLTPLEFSESRAGLVIPRKPNSALSLLERSAPFGQITETPGLLSPKPQGSISRLSTTYVVDSH